VSKKGQRGHFLGVFDLLETQILPKFLVRAPVVVIFNVESKNANHSSFGAGATHREKNPIFCTKNFKISKCAPNFLKFGLELLH